jgi:hypothetical protein
LRRYNNKPAHKRRKKLSEIRNYEKCCENSYEPNDPSINKKQALRDMDTYMMEQNRKYLAQKKKKRIATKKTITLASEKNSITKKRILNRGAE